MPNKKKAAYTEGHKQATPEIVFTPSAKEEGVEFRPSHALEEKVEGQGAKPKRVGGLATKPVKAVMTPRVVAVTSVTFLPEVAQIMLQEDVGALPVVQEDGTLLGIITDRDITVRAVAEGRDINQTQVAEVYTMEDLVTVTPETDINEAHQIMAEHQVRRLPIVETDNRLVGMVSLADLAHHREVAADILKKVSEPGGEHSQ
jgi:CBS domain-containing protein